MEESLRDSGSWIEGIIRDFLKGSPDNTLQDPTGEKAFEDMIVGFSSGDDPLFDAYKEHVGPFHWTPWEIFTRTFPERVAAPDELTVISWILPQREATKADNRKEERYPSERWARARIYGEEANVKLRKQVVAVLRKAGYEAVAPMLSPQWERKKSDRFTFASTWSERHAAYASGLGTFGLCDGLITLKGKAMRTGSVVTRLRIPPTSRPYTEHHAYCLFFKDGSCGECIARCPVGAISKRGHDKLKCLSHLRPTTADYVKARYHFDGYGCGLCQKKVPCESGIPEGILTS